MSTGTLFVITSNQRQSRRAISITSLSNRLTRHTNFSQNMDNLTTWFTKWSLLVHLGNCSPNFRIETVLLVVLSYLQIERHWTMKHVPADFKSRNSEHTPGHSEMKPKSYLKSREPPNAPKFGVYLHKIGCLKRRDQ